MIIFEQNHGRACRLQGERSVCRRVDFREWNAAVSNLGCRIKHSQTKARSEEAFDSRVYFGFADESLMNSIDECGVFLAATEIGPRLDRESGSVGHVLGKFVSCDNIRDRGTVRDDEAFEVPVILEFLPQQHRASARWGTVDSVVGTHDAA